MLLIFIIVRYAVKSGKQRTADLQQLAVQQGFVFVEKGDKSTIKELSPMHLFSQGHSKKIKNALHKKMGGAEISVFDYRYTTGGGKYQNTASQTVMCFKSDELNLPGFYLRPEHVFHKIGGAFGYKDINFESFPEFSKRYFLRGKDEEQVSAVFSGSVISFFENNENLSCEGTGNYMILYKARKKVNPEELPDFIGKGRELFRLFRKQMV
ncbi:hypothetical protein AMJ80_01705 [bacterium SM23_31]|nr:MAG: hypothetical protein AMJ80_01705 [bacterium SM23_31]